MTVKLCTLAHERGYEAYHVAHHGMGSWKDLQVFRRLAEESLVLATNNREDFVDLVSKADLHAGLVVIVKNVRRQGQLQFFAAALDVLAGRTHLTNTVLEVDEEGRAIFYDLPAP